MADNKDSASISPEQLALDDDRRVKSLSPSALVIRKFSRNRLALCGVVMIILMFLFSFLGGVISPYGESQLFIKTETRVTDWAFATVSRDILTIPKNPGQTLSITLRGALVSAIRDGKTETSAGGDTYTIIQHGSAWVVKGHVTAFTGRLVGRGYSWSTEPESGLKTAIEEALANEASSVVYEGEEYALARSGREVSVSTYEELAAATRLVVSNLVANFKLDYDLLLAVEEAIDSGDTTFGDGYALRIYEGDNDAYVLSRGGEDVCVMSKLSIQPRQTGEIIPLDLWLMVRNAIESDAETADSGDTEYHLSLYNEQYSIKKEQDLTVVNMFEPPSGEHILGTDSNGMDVVTRLMYGGRVSLMIGFIVIILGAALGVVLGGIAGYFGKVVDSIIMRGVDVFNCIPAIPLYIIIGSIFEGNKVPPRQRIYYLMILMGVMSWSGIARIVRGQILSLREQEFMLAAEALGIRTSRRIFKHLIPNVIPQLIVWATMGLGDVIIAESTLSFLGLGVKYPMASWGNILNSVNDNYVMTTYLFVWVPAGLLILTTVLGFNFIGDGLRDAFDPKTRR